MVVVCSKGSNNIEVFVVCETRERRVVDHDKPLGNVLLRNNRKILLKSIVRRLDQRGVVQPTRNYPFWIDEIENWITGKYFGCII